MNCKSILELFAIVLLSIVCLSVAVWQLTKTTSEEETNATTTATSAEDKGTIFTRYICQLCIHICHISNILYIYVCSF